jgi:hypothetical protein
MARKYRGSGQKDTPAMAGCFAYGFT